MAFLANASSSKMESLIPPSLRPYILLSYPVSRPAATLQLSKLNHLRYTNDILYTKGIHDIFFSAFCAIAFTVLREVMLRAVLKPFANWWLRSNGRAKRKRALSRAHANGNGNGVLTEKGIAGETKREARQREHTALRFAEQGWSFLYCTVFWTLGMTILLRIPEPLSPESLLAGYPHTLLPALTKFYYLAQLGWWFHQLYVIHSEKPRKDHWQMFSHHILSISLIGSSYYMNYTRIGTLVHVFMDFCDILLPLAKMFRYLSLTTLCDATFVVFLVSWLITRQFGLVFVIQHIYRYHRMITSGWNPDAGAYYSERTINIFMIALTLLLCLTTVWFYMACMVAVRVLRGLGAEDSRSDDEDEASPLEDVPEIHTSQMAESESKGKGLKGVVGDGVLKKRR